MSRVTLIHWNAAEAKDRAKRLRSAGHTVTVFTQSGADLKTLREKPPEVL